MQGRCLADTFSPNYLPLSLVRGYWRLQGERKWKKRRAEKTTTKSQSGAGLLLESEERGETQKSGRGLRIGANEQCKISASGQETAIFCKRSAGFCLDLRTSNSIIKVVEIQNQKENLLFMNRGHFQ